MQRIMLLSRSTRKTTTVQRYMSGSSSSLKIPLRYKKLAMDQGQQALTEYLHATRCVPYAYAEQIAKNSLVSLSNLISKLGGSFSPFTFSNSLNKFLRYHPLNEFELFFESIGVHPSHLPSLLPPNKFFFSEDASLLHAAFALSEFGFPWDKLGLLYMGGTTCMLRMTASDLKATLSHFQTYGFSNVQLVGICLAFPSVFTSKDMGADLGAFFSDLRLIFFHFDLAASVEGNVDAWHDVCRKIRVFYNLNGGKANLGELIGRNKGVILEHGEGDLVRIADYFSQFGGHKEEVARFILQGSELFNFDLETPVVNVLKLLKYFGMSSKDLEGVRRSYAHVLGTIKMANLPNVMKALSLHEWFFNKIKNGNHQLLMSYIADYPNEVQDKVYLAGLKTVHASRTPTHNMSKLNFLHAVGFGENALTMSVLTHLHGTSQELQKRFDFLLRSGIQFSKLCKIIIMQPKVLSQNPEILEQKINFLCQEMGKSLELLDSFPAFLCFDLEKRIKPRYRFHMWIREKGLSYKKYSVASMIATSDKNFVARTFKIHPAAPKHWFEQFYPNKLLV